MDSSRLSVQLLPQNGRPGHFPGLWLGTWKLGGIGFGFQDLVIIIKGDHHVKDWGF